jgi:hypothetical protein
VSHTLGLLGNYVLNVVLGAGAKDIPQALSALHPLGAQIGIIVVGGLLAVSNEVDGLGGSQRRSPEKKKSSLHFPRDRQLQNLRKIVAV